MQQYNNLTIIIESFQVSAAALLNFYIDTLLK